MVFLKLLWGWVSDPVNQKTLTFIGSGIVVVVGAVWSAYKHFFKINHQEPRPKVNVPVLAGEEKEHDAPESLSFVEPLTQSSIECAADYKSYDADRPPSLEFWLGRKNELNLVDGINSGVIAITGIGGQGKSTFTAKALERWKNRFPKAFWDWRDCRENGERFRAQLAAIIERLTCGSVRGNALVGFSDDEVIRYFFKITREAIGLIVFDNVDHYVNIETQELHGPIGIFVNESLRTQSKLLIIITCRPSISYPDIRFREVPLKGLLNSEAKELFRARNIKYDTTSDAQIEEMSRLTNGHPFWLTMIAAQVERFPDTTENLIDELKRGQGEDRRVISMLRPVWKNLNDRHRIILQTMTEAPRNESEDRLYEILKTHIKSKNQFNRTLRTLCAMSLVVSKKEKKQQTLYELHPLVRQFVLSEFPQSERRPFIKLLSDSYQEYVVLIRRNQTGRNFLLAIDKFECAAMSIELEMQAGNYDRAIEIANKIRDAFLDRGLGEEYLRVCIEIIKNVDWHDDLLESDSEFHQFVRELIEVMGEYGRKSDAQNIIEKYNRFAPKGTTVYLSWCKTLCHYNWLIKDYKSAINWGEEGAKLKRESDIDTDIDPLHSLHLAKRDIGQVKEALDFFSQGQNVDDILVTDLSQKKKDAPFFGNIGRCVHLLGSPQKALRFYVRSADILGREKKNSLNLMNLGWASLWIGQACIDLQDWENARLFLSQCLDIWQKRAPLQLELLWEQNLRLPKHVEISSSQDQDLTSENCRKQIEKWRQDIVSPGSIPGT